MKGKILFVAGLGIGYVLGTRAGRERYEQIKKAAEGVWNTPAVQQGVDTVKDFASTRVGDLSDTVLDGVKSFIGNATRGSGATKSDVSSAARTARLRVSKTAKTAKAAVDDAAAALDDAIDEASGVASKATSGARNGGSATTRRASSADAARTPAAERSAADEAKPATSES